MQALTDFIFFLPVVLQILLGVRVYTTNPKALENKLFSLWMVVFAISSSAGLFQRLSRDAQTASLANPFYISFGTFLDALCVLLVVSALYYPEFLRKKFITIPLIGLTFLLMFLTFFCYFLNINFLCNGVNYEDLAFVPAPARYNFIIPVFMSTTITLSLILLVFGYIKGKKKEKRQIIWIFLSLLITSIMAFLAGKFHIISRLSLTFLSMLPVIFFAYFILKHKLFSPIEIAISHALSSMKEGFVVLDTDGKILQLNPAARNMCGKDLGIAEGTSFRDIMLSCNLTESDEEARQDIIKEIERKGKGFVQKEITFVQPEKKIIAMTVSRIEDKEGQRIGTLILSRDVTERRMAAIQIKEGRDFLENIIETSVDGIFVVDKTSAIIRVNKAALDITGYDRDEVLGKTMNIFTADGEEYHIKAREMMKIVRASGKINSYENYIKTKKGEIFPVEWSIARLKDSKGETIGATIIMRDLKERKDMQAQLIQTGKLAAIGELAAGVAHELNNPLTGILGYSQLILEKMGKLKTDNVKPEDFEKITTYQKYIEKESLRCKSIVLSLLKFSRASKFDFNNINVNSVLEDTFVFTEHHLSINKIEFVKDLAPYELLVKGNSHQLQQVFTNIILNALKAMSNGSGKLIAKSRMAEKPGNNGKWVEVEISDTGCGIPDSIINRIFEPFFTTKPPGEGTGLGLSVSYGIIKEHKGEIKVKSKDGEGTSFTISLPSVSL